MNPKKVSALIARSLVLHRHHGIEWSSPTYHYEMYSNHWGRVTHISVNNITNIGSNDGLSSGRHQAIIWTKFGILLIGPLGTNFSTILIEIYTLSSNESAFGNVLWKMASILVSASMCWGRNLSGNQADIMAADVVASLLTMNYNDVIMSAMVSQISSLTIVYSTVYSVQIKEKKQSSASLAFVRGILRWPVNSPHKWPVTRQMFPFDDVIKLTQTVPCRPLAIIRTSSAISVETKCENVNVPEIFTWRVENIFASKHLFNCSTSLTAVPVLFIISENNPFTGKACNVHTVRNIHF